MNHDPLNFLSTPYNLSLKAFAHHLGPDFAMNHLKLGWVG